MEIKDNQIVAAAGEKWDNSVMRVNTKRFVLLKNIKHNIKRQIPQLKPHEPTTAHVALVGGGWSLNETYEELRALYFAGVKIVALNGSAKWLMERNLKPWMHVMLDARPDNAEFVREPVPGCKYFLASQCDPSVFNMVEGRDVTIFHGITEDADVEIKRLNAYYKERWTRVPTAGSVGLTSIFVLRILGYKYQHLFGIDSCYQPDTHKHHSFSQPLNDNEGTAVFKIGGREFECSAWQASQAKSFIDLLSVHGEQINLEVYGDGMLAHILKFGCALPDIEPQTVKES